MSDTSSTALPPVGPARLLRLPFALRGPALAYPVAAEVMRYWDELRGDRPAPARAEIDPARLARALEFSFIAELVAPGVARLRIAGPHLAALLGLDPRGMPLSALLAGEARDELAGALGQLALGARVQLPLRAEGGIGKPGLDGLLVLLPLTDGMGRVSRVLGVLETHGQIGRAPRRFRLRARPQPPAPAAAPDLMPAEAPTVVRPVAPPVAPPVASPVAVASRPRPRLRVIPGGKT